MNVAVADSFSFPEKLLQLPNAEPSIEVTSSGIFKSPVNWQL